MMKALRLLSRYEQPKSLIIRGMKNYTKFQPKISLQEERINEIKKEFLHYDTKKPSEIIVKFETNLVTITLNNPNRLNSLTSKMMANLKDLMDQLQDEVLKPDSTLVGLIIQGEGTQSFCAGFDLDLAYTQLNTTESGEKLCLIMQYITERLRSLPLISVCAIEGYALGGGAELTTAADFRIASEDATVRFLHRNIGTVPGWGGATRLYEILGYTEALYYLGTTNKIILPKIGEGNKFFSLICENGKAKEKAREFLNEFIQNKITPQATHNIKMLLSNMRSLNTRKERLELEMTSFVKQWGSKMNIEAIAAAKAKKGKK